MEQQKDGRTAVNELRGRRTTVAAKKTGTEKRAVFQRKRWPTYQMLETARRDLTGEGPIWREHKKDFGRSNWMQNRKLR